MDSPHLQSVPPAGADPDPPERAPLETLLLRAGLVTLRQIREAQARQRETGTPLAEILVDGGLVTAEQLATLAADDAEGPAHAEAPPVYVVYANLGSGERLEVSEHPDEAAARVSAAGAVELIESNREALLELGERRFQAGSVESVEIVSVA